MVSVPQSSLLRLDGPRTSSSSTLRTSPLSRPITSPITSTSGKHVGFITTIGGPVFVFYTGVYGPFPFQYSLNKDFPWFVVTRFKVLVVYSLNFRGIPSRSEGYNVYSFDSGPLLLYRRGSSVSVNYLMILVSSPEDLGYSHKEGDIWMWWRVSSVLSEDSVRKDYGVRTTRRTFQRDPRSGSMSCASTLISTPIPCFLLFTVPRHSPCSGDLERQSGSLRSIR